MGCENECSICLESTNNLQAMAMLPCSHVFHSDCIHAVLAQSPHCPECRQQVRTSHISSVVMELTTPEPRASSMSMAWKQNGSKLNSVAARLREIRKQDPQAKVLVFVQWSDLEAKVSQALKDHGVPFLALSGRSNSHSRLGSEDGAVLQSFNDNSDGPYALVLSLQRAAAGTNLTSANHVFFVHPMNA